MNNKERKIVIAITGASGSIYARLLIMELLKQSSIAEIALVFSDNGEDVAKYEKVTIPNSQDDKRIKLYNNSDMFSPIASGSARYDSMVIIPCSMGSVGRIANGTSNDLISRAADVMLKERRKLILAVRESPFSTIHLTNMTTLSQSGAIILPLSPSFYSHPENIDDLCTTVVERIVSLLGFEALSYEWKGD